MGKYRIETLLSDVKSLLTSNLNTKIASIEAEMIAAGKPTTGLASVDTTNGYFFQEFSSANLNISPAIFYGIEEVPVEGMGPVTKKNIKMFVELVLTDGGNDAYGVLRILRYNEALADVLEALYDRLSGAAKIKIETYRPTAFKLDANSSETVRVGGVSITTSLA